MKFFEKVALKLGKPDTLAELDISREFKKHAALIANLRGGVQP